MEISVLNKNKPFRVCLLPVLSHKEKGRWQTGIDALVRVFTKQMHVPIILQAQIEQT
jgi:hypothetical protein